MHEMGWNPHWDQEISLFEGLGWQTGRVMAVFQSLISITLASEPNKLTTLKFNAAQIGDPVTGDWALLQIDDAGQPIQVQTLLSRRTEIARRSPGNLHGRHVLAANVDRVFITTSANEEFSRRRLERYLTMAYDSQASPVVVLTKTDLCPDVSPFLEACQASAPGVPVIMTSATQRETGELEAALSPGETAVFLGSSGVGKSTLINALLGRDEARVQSLRDDQKRGRHTTTHRQMWTTPKGTWIIDTPGLRGLIPLVEREGLDQAFGDITSLAATCRFRDCSHDGEPGCAVQHAVQTGNLEPQRLENFLRLRAYQKRFQSERQGFEKQQDRRRDRQFGKICRQAMKLKYGSKS